MRTQRKLLLLSLLVIIVASFSSCIVQRDKNKNWWKHRTKVTRHYHNQTGGRRMWVKNREFR